MLGSQLFDLAASSHHEYFLLPALEKKVKKKYKLDGLPTLKELEQKTVLMFINTDNAIDYPEPIQPNMIQVGGLQIVEPKQLPKVFIYDYIVLCQFYEQSAIILNFSKWKLLSAVARKELF